MKKILYLLLLFIQFVSLRSEPLNMLWRRESAPYLQASSFHPNRDLLAFKYSQTIKVWNYRTGDVIFSYFGENLGTIRELKFSEDGKYLYAMYDNELDKTKYMMWDWETGALADSFGIDKRFGWLKISPDDKYICGIADKVLFVFDRETKTLKHSFDVASGKWALRALYLNGGADLIVLQEKKIKVINLESGEETKSMAVSTENSMAMYVSPSGNYLVLAYQYIYDVYDLNKTEFLKTYKNDFNMGAFYFVSDTVFISRNLCKKEKINN